MWRGPAKEATTGLQDILGWDAVLCDNSHPISKTRFVKGFKTMLT